MKKLIIASILISVVIILTSLVLLNLTKPVIIEGEFKNVVEVHKETEPGTYEIDSRLKKVYINTEDVYISASPDTLKRPGWVNSIVYLKNYEGVIDVVFRTDNPKVTPKGLDFYDYTTQTNTYSYKCEGEYEIDKDSFSCYSNNGSGMKVYEGNFDYAEGSTFFWEKQENVGWVSVGEFQEVERGTYIVRGVDFSKQKYYDYRYFLDFPANTIAKYDIAFSPPEDNIRDVYTKRMSYVLDPWIDNTGAYQSHDYLDVGLTNYYTFDENTGNIAYDALSGNNLTGTTQINWNSGVINSAGNNSLSHGFVFGTKAVLTGAYEDFTFSVWFNPNIEDANFRAIGDFRGNRELAIYNRGGDVQYYPDGINLKTAGSTTVSQWNHYVMVHKNNVTYNFINGVNTLNDSTAIKGSDQARSVIGWDFLINNAGNSLPGLFDEIGIWDRALNYTEVMDLYNNGDGIQFNLTASPTIMDVDVKLNNPEEDEVINISEVRFLCSAGSDEEIANLTLIIMDGDNMTKTERIPLTNLITYYKLNENFATTTINDYAGSTNGISSENTNKMSVEGKLNRAISFNGVNESIDFGNVEVTNFEKNDTFSVSFWAKMNDLNPAIDGMVVSKQESVQGYTGWGISNTNEGLGFQLVVHWENTERMFILYDYASLIISEGVWNHITLTYNGSSDPTGVKVYSNGIEITEREVRYDNLGSGSTKNNGNFSIGSRNNAQQFFNGSIDDLRIYNKTLTPDEVQIIYYNNYGIEGGSIIRIDETKNLSEGSYNWTCRGETLTNQSTHPTQDFLVDFTPPIVTLELPPENLVGVNNLSTGFEVLIRANITEENIDTCWAFNGTTNITLAYENNCTNDHFLTYPIGSNELTFYLNDTAGFQTQDSKTFYVNNIETIESFDNPALEGTNQNFQLNITYDETFFDSVSTSLRYNNTNYNQTFTSPNQNFISEVNITTPGVSEDKQIPYLYTVEFEWTNATGSFNIVQFLPGTSPFVYYHNITKLLIDDCTTTTQRIYNFTIVDEKTQVRLEQNITIEVALTLWNFDYSEMIGQTSFSSSESEVGICVNTTFPSSEGLYLDAKVRYEALNHNGEYYHIERALINNETGTRKITLYNIDNEEYTLYQINVFGTGSLPLSDALINVNREYVAENVFKTVSIPKTDEKGQAIAHLAKENTQYNFIIVQDGVVKASVQKTPICQISPCEINIFTTLVAEEIFEEIGTIYASGIQSSITYNKETKMIQYTFVDITGTADYFRMVVSPLRFNETSSSVCDVTTFSASGVLNCNMTGLTGEYRVRTYVSRSPELLDKVRDFIIDLTLIDRLGMEGVFLIFVMIVMIIFAGAVVGRGDPTDILTFLGVGIILIKLVGILPFGWITVTTINLIIFYLLYKIKT
jgi:hypothetical protein